MSPKFFWTVVRCTWVHVLGSDGRSKSATCLARSAREGAGWLGRWCEDCVEGGRREEADRSARMSSLQLPRHRLQPPLDRDSSSDTCGRTRRYIQRFW